MNGQCNNITIRVLCQQPHLYCTTTDAHTITGYEVLQVDGAWRMKIE